MKKILFIFLLFPIFSYGQIVVSATPQGSYSYSTSAIGAVNSQTYTAGMLYICIHMRVDATTPADFSLTGTSSTWTEIANVTGITTGTDLARLKVWRYAPSSSVTEALSFSGAALQDGSIVVIWEISGVVTTGTNGADGIVQIVTDAQDANANPTITMAALNGNRNTVLAFFGNDANPFGATPETNWTELDESGFSTPTTGGVFISRDNTSDNTPSVTAASSNWLGVAIELNEAVHCSGAPMTITTPATGFLTDGIGSMNLITFTAGKLYVVYAGTSNDAGTVATVALTGTGQTWDEITSAGGVVNGGNRKRVQAFRYAPTSSSSGNTINFTYTGTQDGGWAVLCEISGADISGTNGANAIVHNVLGSANGANPTLTLPSAILNRGTVIFGLANGTNPFTGSPESGFTELVDNGYGTPNTGGYIMYDANTADNTPTVTMSSDNWAGIAIEIRARCRRTNTN